MKKPKNKFTWGDTVRIKHDAPTDLCPGKIVSVCAMVEVSSEDLPIDSNLIESTWLYTVEFGDGNSIEVPEYYLESYSDLKNKKSSKSDIPE